MTSNLYTPTPPPALSLLQTWQILDPLNLDPVWIYPVLIYLQPCLPEICCCKEENNAGRPLSLSKACPLTRANCVTGRSYKRLKLVPCLPLFILLSNLSTCVHQKRNYFCFVSLLLLESSCQVYSNMDQTTHLVYMLLMESKPGPIFTVIIACQICTVGI